MAHHHHHQHLHLHPRHNRPTNNQDAAQFHEEIKRSSSGPVKCATGGHHTPGCTYPTNNSATLPIVLGVLIPLGAALITLIYLHRRNKKRQRLEDANDKHASLDFGLGEVSRSAGPRRGKKKGKKGEPEMMDLNAEREFRLGRGMSMDMGSPYVLPGELQESRPSFHSLSRSATHDSHDPYSPVTQMRSRAASPNPQFPSRTQSRKDSASLWTESSDGTSRNLLKTTQTPPYLTSHISNHDPALPDPPLPEPPLPEPPLPEPPLPDRPQSFSPVEIPQPPDSLSRKPVAQDAIAAPEPAQEFEAPYPQDYSDNSDSHGSLAPRISFGDGQRRDFDFDITSNDYHNSPSIQITASEDDRPVDLQYQETSHMYSHHESAPATGKGPTPSMGPYDDYTTYADVLGIVQKESTDPVLNTPQEQQIHGLGVYGLEQDERRLSTSLRPLPPDDPSDNPEARANRIRSFYREYFDESKTGGGGWGGSVDYYEDYGQEYLNDATMYDPETGQFIVGGGAYAPYAEPIMRRAMTPPPRAPPRFGGPGGSHRHFGSEQFGPGGQRLRGYSSASGQFRKRGPKRPLAPPAPLTNLPTPYLLKDDTAIFSAVDFAPPTLVRDRAAGRADSPFADQRPYSPSVRAFTPLASPFDELSAMPSPHHLRKSGTFTALDFAPPPRLKADGASDSGSIRSGRSNMSATQLANIRAGTYRVSRIPKDYVGTRDDFAQTLRPTWDQRGPTK